MFEWYFSIFAGTEILLTSCDFFLMIVFNDWQDGKLLTSCDLETTP